MFGRVSFFAIAIMVSSRINIGCLPLLRKYVPTPILYAKAVYAAGMWLLAVPGATHYRAARQALIQEWSVESSSRALVTSQLIGCS